MSRISTGRVRSVGCLAIYLGLPVIVWVLANPIRQCNSERKVALQIEELGGVVVYDVHDCVPKCVMDSFIPLDIFMIPVSIASPGSEAFVGLMDKGEVDRRTALYSQMSDEDIMVVVQLPSLRWLDLRGSNVSGQAIERIKQRLPNLNIVR